MRVPEALRRSVLEYLMISIPTNLSTCERLLSTSESDAAIAIDRLTKVFHPMVLRLTSFPPVYREPPVLALENVSLTVRRGEILGLIGTNGAGKTTLIKILATLVLPTGGQATVDGWDLVRDSEQVKGVVGLVTGDERSFYWRLTGQQNLEFFAAFQGLSAEASTKRIDELKQQLGLDVLDRPFGLYSTGMRQRLAIARALLRRPSVLLLDEPTRSLDPLAAGRLHRFLRDTLVRELGCSVLLSTHSLHEAKAVCDRVAVLHHGRLLRCLTVGELIQGAEAVPELSSLFAQLLNVGGDV
jgi:ABC-2 type transport system ATP-binding protein